MGRGGIRGAYHCRRSRTHLSRVTLAGETSVSPGGRDQGAGLSPT